MVTYSCSMALLYAFLRLFISQCILLVFFDKCMQFKVGYIPAIWGCSVGEGGYVRYVTYSDRYCFELEQVSTT